MTCYQHMASTLRAPDSPTLCRWLSVRLDALITVRQPMQM